MPNSIVILVAHSVARRAKFFFNHQLFFAFVAVKTPPHPFNLVTGAFAVVAERLKHFLG